MSLRLNQTNEIDQWDIQFRGILLKTIQVQAKYIELLERKKPSFRLRYQINKNDVPSYADLVFYVRHLSFVHIFHISISSLLPLQTMDSMACIPFLFLLTTRSSQCAVLFGNYIIFDILCNWVLHILDAMLF